MMKNILTLASLALVLSACKKETTEKKVDPQTGKEVAIEVGKTPEKLAISDSLGVYTLKFKLEKGKTYPLKTDQKDVLAITNPKGESMNAEQEMSDEMSFTVKDFSNGVYDITIHLVSKKTANKAQGKTVEVSTQKPEPKEEQLKLVWKVNQSLIGKTLAMKMNEDGKIASIEGFDALYKGVGKAVTSIIKDAKQRTAFVENFKKGFSDKTIKDQFAKNLVILPAKGVKLGESWTKSEDLSQDGKVKLTTKYTLTKVENAVAEIQISGGIPYKSEKQSQKELTHSVSIEASLKGNIKLDAHSGWIQNSLLTMVTTQKESLSNGKESQTMTKKTTSTVKVNP